MTVPRTATRKVTFHDGRPLPMGTHATFKEEGELWVAVPLTKYSGFLTILDNNIGVLNTVREECVRWLTTHPDDVARVGMLLAIIARADDHAKAAAAEKGIVNAL
jgi:hypothetical protein